MPTAINGIGTHYYGKKNPSTRTAACRSCGQFGVLDSYDTRLWFVVIFIPVIPLERKRIIDSCPSCRRHFVAGAAKYEQARQLETSGSLDRFRRDPSTQSALEAHASLLAFHQHEQAGELRASALEKFPDHAGLRAGFAAHLDEVSDYAKAATLFQEALDLDPDLPEARVGVALRRINAGELDEARGLLDLLEAPGAGQTHSLVPLETLAHAYQNEKRHEETLELAACLLRELPQIGQIHKFRSFVAKSERVAGGAESILPRREHSVRSMLRKSGGSYPSWMRKAVLGTIGALLLVTGLVVNNWYIKNHRTIHVVNVTGAPVKVAVDGGPAREFQGEGALVVPEGHHRLQLTGGVDETREVDLDSGFFGRWFSHPAWVLNPGGEAAFDNMTVYYAENPQPSEHDLIVGQPFLALPNVDYVFEEPPATIQSKKSNGTVVKSTLQLVPLDAAETFRGLLNVDRDTAVKFAERRLRREPENLSLLNDYVQTLALTDAPRAVAYLKSGLDRRPVAVAWHRAYQTVAEVTGGGASLVPQYDAYLAASPSDARLLYLRGRIEPDGKRQQEFYQRSIEADPKLSWPWMALGAHAGARAEWAESIRCFRKALELGIDPAPIAEPMHVARLASGEASAMVDEYRKQIMAKPDDLDLLLYLCDALAVSEQGDKINQEIQSWLSRMSAPALAQIGAVIRSIGFYMAGDLEHAAESARSARGMGGDSILAQCLLELGRSGEITDDKSFKSLAESPWNALAVSLGLTLDGRESEAKPWREKATETLSTLTNDDRAAAKILRATEPPPVGDVVRITMDPADKALIFAILGSMFSDHAEEYNAEAAKYNVRRKPPYHLIHRAIVGPAPKAEP